MVLVVSVVSVVLVVLVVSVVLVISVILVVLVVSVVSVFSVVSVIIAPKGKSKPPTKLAAKCKLESNEDIDVEEVTPAKRKRNSITIPDCL